MRIKIFFLLALLVPVMQAGELHFSTAGFYELAGSGREVYNMNVGWQFYKGSCPDAWQREFDDSSWEAVSIPHGLELLPEEASGSINYQGEAWYRKNFSVPGDLKDKKVYLHFEGIMGKSRIWLNGKLLREHYNGYLPIIVDVTEGLNFETTNTLAICADNSDDPSFLPGKPQQALDFTYFGGIYRDCFLIAHNQVHITDANYEDEIAGGGVFIHYPFVSEDKAEIGVKIHLRNESSGLFKGKLTLTLRDISGKEISRGVKISRYERTGQIIMM
nr:sugar-binding domain-containing protein [Bacteroides timonensis]